MSESITTHLSCDKVRPRCIHSTLRFLSPFSVPLYSSYAACVHIWSVLFPFSSATVRAPRQPRATQPVRYGSKKKTGSIQGSIRTEPKTGTTDECELAR